MSPVIIWTINLVLFQFLIKKGKKATQLVHVSPLITHDLIIPFDPSKFPEKDSLEVLNIVSICIHESLSFTCIKLYKGNHIPSKLRHRNFSSRRYSSFRESILDLAHIVPSSLISWSFLVRVYDYLVIWNRVIRKSSSNPSKTNLLKVRLRSYEIANSGARESFIDDMDMMSRGNSRSFCFVID